MTSETDHKATQAEPDADASHAEPDAGASHAKPDAGASHAGERGASAFSAQQMKRRNGRVAGLSILCVVTMLGLSYAAVPLYQMFCQVTGFAGTTQRAARPSEVTLNKTVLIRFDSNISGGLAWEFEPVQRSMRVKIGETQIAKYRAKNLSNETLVGTASFNVTPEAVGAYFNKLDCFCFTEQKLKPGESVEMPVTFFVDPEFAKQAETRGIGQITLSYTFFPVSAPVSAPVSGKDEPKKGT